MQTQAVILAAGFGSRLARDETDIKPLRDVGGSTLIRRNLLLLAASGIERVVVVIGYRAHALRDAVVEESADIPVEIVFVENEEYEKSNGISVLCAAPELDLDDDFLLLMADHVFDRAIVEQASTTRAPTGGAVLLIDRKIKKVFDIDDATKVVTDGERVLEIGKQLHEYNAIDTGMFVCTSALMAALADARSASDVDDCSLSEGVATLRASGRMHVADVGDALWQDVDTELALVHAEKLLRNNLLDDSVFEMQRRSAS